MCSDVEVVAVRFPYRHNDSNHPHAVTSLTSGQAQFVYNANGAMLSRYGSATVTLDGYYEMEWEPKEDATPPFVDCIEAWGCVYLPLVKQTGGSMPGRTCYYAGDIRISMRVFSIALFRVFSID